MLHALSREEPTLAGEAARVAIEDPDVVVQRGAIAALRSLRTRPAVHTLIRRLEQENSIPVAEEIASVLGEITGQDHGLDAAGWRRWWEGRGETWEPADRVYATTAVVDDRAYGFFGIPLLSERIIFVYDVSTSMRDLLPLAAEELRSALRQLSKRSGAVFGLVAFSIDVDAFSTKLARVGRRRANRVPKWLSSLTPGNHTSLGDALEVAFDLTDPETSHADLPADTIVILSDGAGNFGSILEGSEILRQARRRNPYGLVRIHSIQLGQAAGLLRRLPEITGGEYRLVRPDEDGG